MINKAKEKLRNECEGMDSPIAKMLCQQIIDSIKTPRIAERILDPEKSLTGCKKIFDDYARKHKTGHESVITPEAAQGLIEEYFGFEVNRQQGEMLGKKVIDITELF